VEISTESWNRTGCFHFDVNVDRSLQRALSRLEQVETKPQFAGVLREFMASLKEGHAEVFAGHLEVPLGRFWPLVLRPVREGVAVAGGNPEHLRSAGIQTGDLLLKADGQSIDQRWNAIVPRVSASTETARRRIALDRLTATAAADVQLELQRADGSRYVCTLPTAAERPRAAHLPAGRLTAWQKLHGDVGYLHVPTFAWQPPVAPKSGSVEDLDEAMQPAKRELDEAFSALASTQSLILDLRGNPGGSVFLASYLAEHLLPPGFVYHSGERRRSPEALLLPDLAALPADQWGKPHPWKPSEMAGVRHVSGPSHRGKLLVLIDELCFSSVDDLAACLADLHSNVHFVGRPTNGGTGEPRVITRLKHSQTDVQFCLIVMRSPRGRLIEGRGTEPQLRVTWTREDLARGRDPDLAAALRLASPLAKAGAALELPVTPGATR
jgi:C-terminal processing protease CtpA/Prc